MTEHILRHEDGSACFAREFQPVTIVQPSAARWLSVPEANDIIRAAMMSNIVNIAQRRCVIRTIHCKG